MTKRVAKKFRMFDPKKGVRVTFLPGDDLPKHLEDLVKNPNLVVSSEQALADEEEEEVIQDPLEDLKVPQLIDLANQNDVEIIGLTRKADIKEAIEKHFRSKGIDARTAVEELDAGDS